MGFLLDTHALIWLLEKDRRLPENTARILNDVDAVSASLVSYWEMAIKLGIEKLEIKGSLSGYYDRLPDLRIELLTPSFADIQLLVTLSPHHRDPFDRMLVAQAMTHGLTIVTKDQNIPLYGVPVLW